MVALSLDKDALQHVIRKNGYISLDGPFQAEIQERRRLDLEASGFDGDISVASASGD
ncbi:MAG: hypothetical protein ACRD44_18895 [Bryobacteraceae bacterium]